MGDRWMNLNQKIIFKEETFLINGACMEVYRTLGSGFLESVYQECVEFEFKKRAIPFESQKLLTLNYQGLTLKQYFKADFICYGKIIVELKAITRISSEHTCQVLNYLKATNYNLGLRYNFGHYPLLEIRRIPNL